MKRLYRELEIDNMEVISEKALRYFRENTPIFTEEGFTKGWLRLRFDRFTDAVPELLTAFKRYDMTPTMVGAYVTEQYQSIRARPPHIDEDPHKARINIPIFNVAGTRTEFFENVVTEFYIDPETNVPTHRTVNDDYRLIDVVYMKQATILDVTVPHRVVVPDGLPLPRVTISIRMDKDPYYLLDY